MSYPEGRVFLTKDGPAPGRFKAGASLAEVRAALLAGEGQASSGAEEGQGEGKADQQQWASKLQELVSYGKVS